MTGVRQEGLAGLSSLLPQRSDWDAMRRSPRGDLVAGVTVAIIALPLALAFGVTSGLGAQAGLVPAGLPSPSLAWLDLGAIGALLPAAVAVAALAALESLLSATVADAMSVNEEHDPDRELFGQGLANLATADPHDLIPPRRTPMRTLIRRA